MKAFPQVLKVLYNTDCVSDQAIVYWHQKGSKAQGRQHFLKSTETLVKVKAFFSISTSVDPSQFLQEQEDSDEEEE